MRLTIQAPHRLPVLQFDFGSATVDLEKGVRIFGDLVDSLLVQALEEARQTVSS